MTVPDTLKLVIFLLIHSFKNSDLPDSVYPAQMVVKITNSVYVCKLLSEIRN